MQWPIQGKWEQFGIQTTVWKPHIFPDTYCSYNKSCGIKLVCKKTFPIFPQISHRLLHDTDLFFAGSLSSCNETFWKKCYWSPSRFFFEEHLGLGKRCQEVGRSCSASNPENPKSHGVSLEAIPLVPSSEVCHRKFSRHLQQSTSALHLSEVSKILQTELWYQHWDVLGLLE